MESMDNFNLTELVKILKGIQPIRIIEWSQIKMLTRIGQGAFGSVIKVEVPDNPTPMSMKIYTPLEESSDMNQRFLQEIQFLHSCSHPNILPLYGISINYESHKIGIITPLQWGSLAQLIDFLYKGQPLPNGMEFTNEIKQKIILGISAGLFYLSTKNIIHRDLKPENILLDNNFNPLLCDFFCAEKILRGDFLHEANIGTVLYNAPEIFLGEKYNEKVDIFSWALVINSILTEERPYNELLNENPMINHFSFFQQVEQGIRPKLIEGQEFQVYRELIRRGWDKNPAIRPTAQEIIETLLKDEANLPNVDVHKMKQYQKEVLYPIPEFLILKLEKVERQFEQQAQLLINIQKQLEKLEEQKK